MVVMKINRRQLIIAGAAGFAAAALPSSSCLDVPIAAAPLPAWAVGTPGDWDWHAISAPTERAAKLLWCEETVGADTCEGGPVIADNCRCDFCQAFSSIEAQRRPEWDGKGVTVGDIDWFESGFGTYCARCSYETDSGDGGHFVNGKAICIDCMAQEDWEVVDPEYAAEMRMAKQAHEEA